MTTAWTTKERVKRRGDLTGDKLDSLINELIAEVSMDFEIYLGRHVLIQERTEVERLRAHQHTFSLKGAPVTSVTSLKYNSRDYDWANVDAIDEVNYRVDSSLGQVYLRGNTPYEPGYVQVIYTGGLVTPGDDEVESTAAFISALPILSGAADQQIVEILRRRKTPTGTVQLRGSMNQQPAELRMLSMVKQRLDRYRRRGW